MQDSEHPGYAELDKSTLRSDVEPKYFELEKECKYETKDQEYFELEDEEPIWGLIFWERRRSKILE